MTNTQKRALKELLIEALGDIGKIDIKEATARMRQVPGFFTEEFYARAQAKSEEDFTGRIMRTVKDEDGVPKYVNVTTTDAAGNVSQEYVQIPLLDLEQFKQQADYRVKMALRHLKVLKALTQECKAAHNRKLPVQLSLIERELRELKPIARAERMTETNGRRPSQPRAER